MLLHYLGHAGWLFEENGTRLVCDPWLSQQGAFYASWFPFPANDHIRLPTEVSAIYISHAHEDHFDAETLMQFPRDTKIVIAKFNDPVLVEGLASLGFNNIQLLSEGELSRVGCFSVQILRDEDSGMYHDSAISVRSPTAAVLNINDCRVLEPSRLQLDRVDVLLGQFSGANWYPVVYEYSESYGRSLAAAKRLRGLERLAYAAEQFGAAVTIPCSGPAAFLDPVLFHNNDVSDSDDNPFPMMDTAAKFLESRGCPAFLTMPGDIIEARDGSLTLESRSMSDREVYGDREKYLRNYAERKRPVIDGCLRGLKTEPLAGEILKQEFVRILRSSKVLVEQIKGVVRFQLLGVQRGDIVLDCAEGIVPTIRDYTGEDVNYRFTVDHRFVHDVLKGRFINFESVFLGMRFTAWRNPDVFNDALFTILVNFDDTRLQQADREFQCESAASGGVFEVVNDGACYLVQRRCPHMGSDLSVVGQVSGGMITCARHGWQFRLSDGACVNVSAPPIFVQHKTMSDRSSDCL